MQALLDLLQLHQETKELVLDGLEAVDWWTSLTICQPLECFVHKQLKGQ